MLWSLKYYVKKTACSKIWKEPNWNTEIYRFHDSTEVKIGADTLGKGENDCFLVCGSSWLFWKLPQVANSQDY